jgi:uncharacterized membrane protein YgcG
MSLLRRGFAVVFLALGLTLSALAQEEIRRFHVEIEVEQDGDIVVTETIAVNVEGREIRRGIFRELPANYLDDETGGDLPYRYDILSVQRDGDREPYSRETTFNAVQIRIGDADKFLDRREHVYELRYRVKNQIRQFETHDELYWNVTGSYWQFPILSASAVVRFPSGASAQDVNVYTGSLGSTARNADYQFSAGVHRFATTQPLQVREGLTVSLILEKGIIDPPSLGDKSWLWWARNGSLTALVGSFFSLLIFYYRSFDRVGRDPTKGPVFPQYEPPEGYSPAAAHHIYHRGFSGHEALTASLMYLSAKGFMRIDVDPGHKTRTTLTKRAHEPADSLSPETRMLFEDLFGSDGTVHLGEKYDASFTSAYNAFKSDVTKTFGSSYFKWNAGYVVAGGVLSVLAIVFAIIQFSFWSAWHTAAIIALVALNLLFMYLMPAPTRRGQDVRTHLEGFRLYMQKAEQLQLNSVKIGSDAPPPMTVERYETFLPYAVALGVEKPWTKHFERLIPEEAKDYNPGWTNMKAARFGSAGSMTRSMVSGISSGVATSLPQSSSSSGGGGGGFSGGGGGGGGGGGW